MKTGYAVGDVMTYEPVICKPDITIRKAAQIMLRNDVGSILVIDGFLLGIITETDIVRTIVAKEQPITKTVEECMTRVSDLVTIEPENDIYDALVLMRNCDVRRLPVTNGKNLVGMITAKDILRVKSSLIELIQEEIFIREEEQKLERLNEANE